MFQVWYCIGCHFTCVNLCKSWCSLNESLADLCINILAKLIYENAPKKCVKRSMNYPQISSGNVGENKLKKWLKLLPTYKPSLR